MTKLDYTSTTEKPAIELLCGEIQDDLRMVLAVAGTILQKTRNRVQDQKAAIVARWAQKTHRLCWQSTQSSKRLSRRVRV